MTQSPLAQYGPSFTLAVGESADAQLGRIAAMMAAKREQRREEQAAAIRDVFGVHA